ncbi:MAG: hypothetical protein JJV98_11460 [Desulfosarcina sp.]|nr:hypothetical protein [Desulfobacterales bacterium]
MSANDHDGRPIRSLTAERTIAADWLWFEGHFPGDPLLPGVAQIQLVLDTINAALGTSFDLIALKRVRFRNMIRPNDRIQIRAWADTGREGVFRFRIAVGDTVACTGTVHVGASADV